MIDMSNYGGVKDWEKIDRYGHKNYTKSRVLTEEKFLNMNRRRRKKAKRDYPFLPWRIEDELK